MKRFDAVVISAKMKDTVIVEVERRTPHPLYRKLIKRSKTYKVSPNGMDVKIGQRVKILETRPMSKGKYFEIENKTKKEKKEKK